jgi:hypothetical protein
MAITVARFRASLLWTWTGKELLPADSDAAPDYWVSSREQYVKAFDALRRGESTSHGVSFPWPPGHLQRFWSFYTAETGYLPKHQRDIEAKTAYYRLVPFRVAKLLPGVVCPDGVVLTQEAFLLPVGLAIALSVDVKCDLALDRATDRLIELCSEPLFQVPGSNTACSLVKLREQVCGQLALAAALPVIQKPLGYSEPFSLTTITSACGADMDEAVAADQRVLKAVQAMSSLPDAKRHWRDSPLNPLDDAILPQSKNRPSAHFCFTSPNGRCVWHPRFFGPEATGKEAESLNCYHRNLLFGALQVQSLANFVRLVQEQHEKGVNLNGATDRLASKACDALGRLYGKAAYHSWSVRRWIDDHPDEKAIIEKERGAPLHG